MVSEKPSQNTEEDTFVFTKEEKARAIAERKLADSMGNVLSVGQTILDHCVKHTSWKAYTDKKGKAHEAGEIDVIDPTLVSELLMKASPRGYPYKGDTVSLIGKMVKYGAGGNFGKSVKVECI